MPRADLGFLINKLITITSSLVRHQAWIVASARDWPMQYNGPFTRAGRPHPRVPGSYNRAAETAPSADPARAYAHLPTCLVRTYGTRATRLPALYGQRRLAEPSPTRVFGLLHGSALNHHGATIDA